MGEAYVKTASVTVKHDPSVSASVLQTKLEPFVKTWWQTHSAGRCRASCLCPGVGESLPTLASGSQRRGVSDFVAQRH